MRKKKSLLYILFIMAIIICAIYIYIGIIFGKGVSKFGKDIYNVNQDWQKNNEQPLDTIVNLIKTKSDSIKKGNNFNTPKSEHIE